MCIRDRPAGNGGLADTEAMPGEEIRNCADAFSFAAQLPNDFGVVVELRAGRVRLQPLRYIEDLIFISHRHSWRSAGNVGNPRIVGRERVGRIGIELFGPWE